MATLQAAISSFKEMLLIKNALLVPSEVTLLSLYGDAAYSGFSYWTWQIDKSTGRTGYKPAAGTTFVALGLIGEVRPSSSSAIQLRYGESNVGTSSSSDMTNGAGFFYAAASPSSGAVFKESFYLTIDGAHDKFIGGYWVAGGSGVLYANLIGFEIPTPNY